jgi:hypothetical protein
MEVLELAVTQFGDLGPTSLLVSHLQNVHDFAAGLGFVVDDLRLEVHHQLLYDSQYHEDWRLVKG